MDDDPKIVEIDNTFIYIYIKMIVEGGFEPHIWNTTKDIITIKLSLKPKKLYIYIYILVNFTFKNIFAHPVHRSTQLKVNNNTY